MSMTTLATRDEEQRSDEPTTADATEICPECGGDVHPDTGVDVTCDDCGLVVDRDEIDRGPEWRYFETDTGGETSQLARCSGESKTATMHDQGLGSQMGYDHGWESHTTHRLHRLKTMDNRLKSRERVLLNGLLEARRIGGAVGVGWAARERAAAVFREAQEEGLLQGRSADAFAAAAMWIACREQDLPVLFDDIAGPSSVDGAKIRRTMLVIRSEMGIYALPPEPSGLIHRIASGCEVDAEPTSEAADIAADLEATGEHGGHKPEGIAAACVYCAVKPRADNDLTQEDIADVADVSSMTLRQGVRLLESEVFSRDD